MLKKEITYESFDGNDIQEITVTLLFHYTLVSVKLYEQNTGGNFFEDLQAALKTFGELSGMEEAEATDMAAMLPHMASPEVQGFIFNALPCLYATYDGGRLIQDENTHAEAVAAPWLAELTGLDFFFELFGEINKTGGLKLKTSPGAQRKKG